MNKVIPLLLLYIAVHLPVFGQQELPLIRATSKVADIRDGDDFQQGNWHISPEIKPDIFYANRSKRPKRVTFYTDVDSISFVVAPDSTYNFAILLNEDTAFTQISTMSPPVLNFRKAGNYGLATSDTIPFTFGRGNKIYVKGKINNSAPLDLMFDLGSNQIVISKRGLDKNVNIQFDANQDNVAFGGNTTVQHSTSNTLQLGGLVWDSVPIARIDQADADGIIGYNAFDGRIIEIDYDQQRLIVHPSPVAIGQDFDRMEMRFKGGLPFLEATLVNGDKAYREYFEFDTGSNGSLWINQSFASEHNLYGTLEKIGETTSHGLGGSIRNQTVLFPKIRIGNQELTQVPVDLELPSEHEHLRWGIFGMDILKRFNVIIDFQQDSIYLKPNALIDEPYNKPFNNVILLAALAALMLLTGFFFYNRRRKRNKRMAA